MIGDITFGLVEAWAEGHPEEERRMAWLAQAEGVNSDSIRRAFLDQADDAFWQEFDDTVRRAFGALGYDYMEEP